MFIQGSASEKVAHDKGNMLLSTKLVPGFSVLSDDLVTGLP